MRSFPSVSLEAIIISEQRQKINFDPKVSDSSLKSFAPWSVSLKFNKTTILLLAIMKIKKVARNDTMHV